MPHLLVQARHVGQQRALLAVEVGDRALVAQDQRLRREAFVIEDLITGHFFGRESALLFDRSNLRLLAFDLRLQLVEALAQD